MVIIGLFLTYAFVSTTFNVFRVGKLKKTGLPVIGNLHLLGDQPRQSLAKLSKIYGSIMSLKLGQVTTLVISSADAAKEVRQKQDVAFCTRDIPDALHAHEYYRYSVGFLPEGTHWRFLRKILNTNIFSGKSLDANQHIRLEKVKELIAYCQKSSMSNDYVDIGRAAFRTTLNLLSNIILSKDLAN